jgi:hypothetical protein
MNVNRKRGSRAAPELRNREYGTRSDEKPRSSESRSATMGTPYTATSHQSLEVHIEELVLYGFAPAERYRIGEAVERELTRLFTEQGAPPAIKRGGEFARLDGGAFEVRPGSNSKTIGAQLANAIYGRFVK